MDFSINKARNHSTFQYYWSIQEEQNWWSHNKINYYLYINKLSFVSNLYYVAI